MGRRTDIQTDMTMLVVDFRNLANATEEALALMVASGFERAVVRILTTYPACRVYMLHDMYIVATLYNLSEQNADTDVFARASAEIGVHSGWRCPQSPQLSPWSI